MFRPQVEAVRVDLTHFATAVAGGAFNVLGGHSVGAVIAGLSDVVKVDAHAGPGTYRKLLAMQGTAPKNDLRELLIHTPDGKTRTLTLDRDRFGVGRSRAKELCYPEDAGLSRQHLVIERTPTG